MAVLETAVGIILVIGFLITIVTLTKRWGKRFLYITITGFFIYVLSIDPGIGIGISFIIIMSYLCKKLDDFNKPEKNSKQNI